MGGAGSLLIPRNSFLLVPLIDRIGSFIQDGAGCAEDEDDDDYDDDDDDDDDYEIRAGCPEDIRVMVENLKDVLKVIHGVVQRAEDLEKWGFSGHVKSAHLGDLYDAEDMLDRLQHQILQDMAKSRLKKDFVRLFCFPDKEIKELQEIVGTFDRMAREGFFEPVVGTYHLKAQPRLNAGDFISKLMDQQRRIPAAPMKPELVGREREREDLVNLLLGTGNEGGSSNINVRVVSIAGEGGAGKSALARWAYSDQRVRQHFDLTAWVCVSDKFEVKRLMMEIMKSACIEVPRELRNLENMDNIERVLQVGFKGKRFLVVLDDVWNEDVGKWEILLNSLKSGKEGSRLLITTRISKMAYLLASGTHSLILKGLRFDDCLSLLRQSVFSDSNPMDHPQLLLIGMRIASRLGGLPLAAKMLGSVLKSSFEISNWRKILEILSGTGKKSASISFTREKERPGKRLYDEDSLTEHIPPLSHILKLSYEHLPKDLRQCFVYCILFPKDYRFEKDRLVRLWMAQGFIRPNGNKNMEDIGRDYFDELLRRSFFEKQQYQDGYVIHDLLHVFAESVTCDDFLRIEGDWERPKYSNTVCHLYVGMPTDLPVILKGMVEVGKLRTLVVHGRFNFDCLPYIFEELRGLRVLILSEIQTELFPEFIDKLIHLRYLEIHMSAISKLPESLCSLYHLQGLDVRYCHNLRSLPAGLHNLINLRYLKR